MTLDLCLATAKGWVVLMNLLVLVFKTHMFNKFLFFIKISIQNQPEMLYLKILKLTYIFVYIVIYMEKEMAPHSSIHAWKMPWTEEPGISVLKCSNLCISNLPLSFSIIQAKSVIGRLANHFSL